MSTLRSTVYTREVWEAYEKKKQKLKLKGIHLEGSKETKIAGWKKCTG